MKKLLTVKYAILLKCRDCVEGRLSSCTFKKCQLFEKGKAGATGRAKAVKDYCRWCRNGLSMTACVSPTCSIYQYKNKIKVSEKIIHPKRRVLSDEQKKAVVSRFAPSRRKKVRKGLSGEYE